MPEPESLFGSVLSGKSPPSPHQCAPEMFPFAPQTCVLSTWKSTWSFSGPYRCESEGVFNLVMCACSSRINGENAGNYTCLLQIGQLFIHSAPGNAICHNTNYLLHDGLLHFRFKNKRWERSLPNSVVTKKITCTEIWLVSHNWIIGNKFRMERRMTIAQICVSASMQHRTHHNLRWFSGCFCM